MPLVRHARHYIFAAITLFRLPYAICYAADIIFRDVATTVDAMLSILLFAATSLFFFFSALITLRGAPRSPPRVFFSRHFTLIFLRLFCRYYLLMPSPYAHADALLYAAASRHAVIAAGYFLSFILFAK